jgi:hypothetical protein
MASGDGTCEREAGGDPMTQRAPQAPAPGDRGLGRSPLLLTAVRSPQSGLYPAGSGGGGRAPNS